MTFPMVIFGVLAVTAGLMILWLPETLHSNMCQTIEEVSLAEERYDFIWMGKRVGNPISSLRWVICHFLMQKYLFWTLFSEMPVWPTILAEHLRKWHEKLHFQ